MIESRATRQFCRLFQGLPSEVRLQAESAYKLFRVNPVHPGLQFKKMEGEDAIYSVRIGLGHRALGAMKKRRIVRFWIGSHAEYDRLV